MATGGSSGEGPSSNLSKELQDQFLQCKICLDNLSAPKTLPCLHTFCYTCIDNFIICNRIDDQKFSCPVCRRYIFIPKDGAIAFPDSFFVSNLKDLISQSKKEEEEEEIYSDCGICRFKVGPQTTAKVLCTECQIKLCDQCKNEHTEAQLTADHTLLPLSTSDTLPVRRNHCRLHKSQIVKYYCQTCNSPVCLPCTFIDHQGHDIQDLKEIRNKNCEKLERLVLQSDDNLLQLQDTKVYLSEVENEMFIRKELVKNDIRRTIQNITDTLHKQENRIVRELDAFYNMTPIISDQRDVERVLKTLDEANCFAKQLLDNETSPITQIVNHNDAVENLQKALETEIPDVKNYESYLRKYAVYYPGHIDINLGSLLIRNDQNSMAVNSFRGRLPVTRAVYKATLKHPQELQQHIVAMACTSSDYIVVITLQAKKVKIFTPNGDLYQEFGTDSDIEFPSDVAITRDQSIAITDIGAKCVRVFNIEGEFEGHFGDSNIFSIPISLAVSNAGYYIVYDQGYQQLTFHSSIGSLLKTIPTPEAGMVHKICSTHNKLYLNDPSNKIITVYTCNNTDTELITRFVAVDYEEEGSIQETESNASTPTNEDNPSHLESPSEELPSLSTEYDSSQLLGHSSASSDMTQFFLDCTTISTDHHGTLYISDQAKNRVHTLSCNGELSALRFVGKSILRPSYICISSSGNLTVCQQGVDLMSEEEGTSGDRYMPNNQITMYRLLGAEN